MEQTKIQSIVDGLYKAKPDLINSDKLLLLTFWRRQGLELTEKQMDIFFGNCSTAESITRAARKSRAKNDYELGKKVAEPVREGRFRKFLGFKHA